MVKFLFFLLALVVFTKSQEPYNQQYAKLLAAYSCIAYCDTRAVQNWNCDLCKKVEKLTDIKQINSSISEVVGFIGYHPQRNRIIWSWRGSETTQNWIEDFIFDKMDYIKCKNCQIHEGFYLSYQVKAKQILQQNNMQKNIQIVRQL